MGIRTFISQFWSVLCEMAPYLLLGFLVAGILSVLVPKSFVERHLGKRGIWSVFKASLLGIPLPLCSCGVIPVGASLRSHGATRGATSSFLLSTPQTGVDSILVTYSLLGWVFAVYRVAVAFISGVLGGALVDFLSRNEPEKSQGDPEPKPSDTCESRCCETSSSTGAKAKQGQKPAWLQMLTYGFLTLPRDIGWSLVIGLLIAGVISTFIQPGAMAPMLGNGILPMLFAMVVGIPMYVCATASVPIAAALIVAGVSPGAALVFLVTGPATNAATISTIWKILGRKSALVYLATVAVSALAAGFILDAIYASPGIAAPAHAHQAGSSLGGQASAVLLIAVLAYALVSKQLTGRKMPDPNVNPDESTSLAIGGMNCSHCVQAVERALTELPEVTSATVDLDSGRALVTGKGIRLEALVASVAALGYSASVINKD